MSWTKFARKAMTTSVAPAAPRPLGPDMFLIPIAPVGVKDDPPAGRPASGPAACPFRVSTRAQGLSGARLDSRQTRSVGSASSPTEASRPGCRFRRPLVKSGSQSPGRIDHQGGCVGGARQYARETRSSAARRYRSIVALRVRVGTDRDPAEGRSAATHVAMASASWELPAWTGRVRDGGCRPHAACGAP